MDRGEQQMKFVLSAALLKTSIYTWNRFVERLCWNKHGHNKENINISQCILMIQMAFITT